MKCAEMRRLATTTVHFPLRLDRGEGQGEVSNLPCSEGLASVYLKFKQLKVPAAIHQQSTLNLQLPQTKPAGKWIERFEEWLADGGFLKSLR
jgi:hypothetical protein